MTRNYSITPNAAFAMDKTITMYGAEWCIDCRRAKNVLDELGTDFLYVDLEADVTGADRAFAISGRTNIPVIVFPDGSHVVEPTDADLRERVAGF
jgi:mycoredoxin